VRCPANCSPPGTWRRPTPGSCSPGAAADSPTGTDAPRCLRAPPTPTPPASADASPARGSRSPTRSSPRS
jgi:hypothetical protein